MSEIPMSSNDRSRTYWSPTMERYFIDLMLDQVDRGNRAGHTFNKQAWADMLTDFNAKFGSHYDKDVLKGRYTNLWKQFNDVKTLLGQSGFSWDETRHMVVADDIVWNDYLKENPEVRSCKSKSFPNFNDLCLIYGHTTADGRYSRSSHDRDFDYDLQCDGFYDQTLPSIGRLRTDWTPTMDKYFIELLLDQVGRGRNSGTTFTKQAWNDMLASFNANFGPKYGKRVLKHRYNKMLNYYRDATTLFKQDGFSWDETRQMVTADDDVWEAYIKENPYAQAYRNKTLPNYNDLVLVYENMVNTYTRETQGQLCQSKDPKSEKPVVGKGEGKANQKKSTGDRTRTVWTLPMDHFFIDLLLAQVLRGNKRGQTFITQAWKEMTASFNAFFKSRCEKGVLKNRYKHLKKQFNEINNLLKQDGFSWDESRGMLTAEDNIWDAYTKENPSARAYRVKKVPSFDKLCVVFGEEIFSGHYNRLSLNIDPDCELPILMTGDDEKAQYTSINNPSEIEWTEEMDRHFISQMLELVYGIGHIPDSSIWSRIVPLFNEKFAVGINISTLEERYTFLVKQNDEISSLLTRDGFSWDEIQQSVTAEDHIWQAYIKDHPEAIAYRHKCLGYYNDLRKVCSIGVQAESFGGQGRCERERKSNAQETGGGGTFTDHQYPSTDFQAAHQQRKRPGSDMWDDKRGKASRTGVQLPPGCQDAIAISECPKEQKSYPVEGAVRVLQTITGVDDDFLLDACDLLEDEKKAKIFLALKASLRNKWLLRKLRRSSSPTIVS